MFESELLESIRPECASNCNIAQAIARQAGACALSDELLPIVRKKYSSATEDCTGPETYTVCGAPEGEKTYKCPVSEKLALLCFSDVELSTN
jgi:hypothetical protein